MPGSAEQFFDTTKRDYIAALGNIVFPPATRAQLRPIIERSTLVTDNEFNNHARQQIFLPASFDIVMGTQHYLSVAQSLTLLPNENNRYTRMIFRLSQVDGTVPRGREFFWSLFAEQIASSYLQVRRYPLPELADDSLLFLPFENKTALLDRTQRARRDFYGVTDPVIQDQFEMETRGFRSNLVEQLPDQQERSLPSYDGQTSLERARVAVLQTLFASAYLGLPAAEQGKNSVQQFAVGVHDITAQGIQSPGLFAGDMSSLQFLREYIDQRGLVPGTRELTSKLSWMNFEEFVSSLNTREFAYFSRVLDAAASGQSIINAQRDSKVSRN